MAVTGAIAERVRGILPTSYDMLIQSAKFGEAPMQSVINTVKLRTFGSVLPAGAEGNYPLTVIDYVAKLIALELITPAIDAWRAEPYIVGTTGTNEQLTYSEATTALGELRKALLEQTRRDWPLVAPLITYRAFNGGPRPAINTINDEFLTPSPQEFQRPYRITDFS